MPEMKDSGIEWIGEIPKEWSISKLKYELSEPMKYGASETGIDYDEKLYRYIRITDITTDGKLKDEGKLSLSESQAKGYILKNDTVLFARSGGTVGKSFLYKKEYGKSAFAGYLISAVADNKKIYPKWLMYYTGSSSYKEWTNMIFNQATIQNIGADKYNNMQIPVAPLDEQNKIIDFLDSKCSEIDALTADIQKEIEVLEEYKKSIITEAVTKGLEPNVEMKDSGIEWVGEIPSHWEIHPVYNFFGERKAKNYALKEQNLLSLSYGRIIRKDINTNGGLLPASFNTYNIVESGDIIIRPTDLQNDKKSLRTGLVTEHGIITSAYIDLQPKNDVNSKYFHYLLHAYDVMKVFYNMGNGVRQGLNYSEFSKLMVFAPPILEQAHIADFLDNKCSEIDRAVAEKREQLTTLEEYKKSVIYEYVTGKKEVTAQ